MKVESIKLKGHRCFKNDWAGFDELKPINVIIGKNNTGKSRLLDLIQFHTDYHKTQLVEYHESGSPRSMTGIFQYESILDSTSLMGSFRPGYSGDGLPGEQWNNHGRFFVDQRVRWSMESSGAISSFELLGSVTVYEGLIRTTDSENIAKRRSEFLCNTLLRSETVLARKNLRRLNAERDILPETQNNTLQLKPSGEGASNIIRRYKISARVGKNRELIDSIFLSALNRVFGNDGHFTEIGIHEYDEHDDQQFTKGSYEIYLNEEKKGRIPLSQSGSGLKTIILVLLNLLVIPEILTSNPSDFVYIFEELENNLHPSLLRRLLSFIESHVVRNKCIVFLTTHSSATIDVFGSSENAQTIYVSHNGETAKTERVRSHFEKHSAIAELGVKPSDLLQANGVIWCEGPSDRIYINRWIELVSGGDLREGRDYQCAFFGGSLLANDEFIDATGKSELANLLRLNTNLALVCDSDKVRANAPLKERVERVKNELAKNPSGFVWVTEVKEIENYLPLEALKSLEEKIQRPPGQFEQFFPNSGSSRKSYWKEVAGRKSVKKVELASKIAPELTTEMMDQRFDWRSQMDALTAKIRKWNT